MLAEREPAIRRPGLMRCVNRLGGRIVLSPTSFTTRSANFFGYYKREVLRRLIAWLSPGAMPAAVLEAPNVSLTVNRSADGTSLILTLINLCTDPVPTLKLALAPAYAGSRVERLEEAAWQPVEHAWHDAVLELPLDLELLKPQILRCRR